METIFNVYVPSSHSLWSASIHWPTCTHEMQTNPTKWHWLWGADWSFLIYRGSVHKIELPFASELTSKCVERIEWPSWARVSSCGRILWPCACVRWCGKSFSLPKHKPSTINVKKRNVTRERFELTSKRWWNQHTANWATCAAQIWFSKFNAQKTRTLMWYEPFELVINSCNKGSTQMTPQQRDMNINSIGARRFEKEICKPPSSPPPHLP